MLKTHEKSRIYPVRGSYTAEEIKEVVLQMEPTRLQSNGNYIYLVETASKEEYNRTTAEGRAAVAEAELAAEIEAVHLPELQPSEFCRRLRPPRRTYKKEAEEFRRHHKATMEEKRIAELEEQLAATQKNGKEWEYAAEGLARYIEDMKEKETTAGRGGGKK